MAAVLFLPVAFPLLFGYAVEAVRSSQSRPQDPPPGWRLSWRLVRDGLWTALLLALLTAPFAIAFWPLAQVLYRGRQVISSQDAFIDRLFALAAAGMLLALPWGLVLLLFVPANVARFAASGRAGQLFNAAGALRLARAQFGTWNLALATVVTGWALGLAAGGLLCVGIIPGAFYAILVSAHASARLQPAPSGPAADPPAG
jgi:hypothetical protein